MNRTERGIAAIGGCHEYDIEMQIWRSGALDMCDKHMHKGHGAGVY